MIPEMPPQRNAKPVFAPSSIIERAAQHLDWTVAFGMRHNTLRGVEETTSQRARPDPPHIARASRLRSSRTGGRRLLLTSRLCLASVVVAAAAAGTGIFLLAHSAGEKAAAKNALATEAPAKASEATSLIRGWAMMPPAASTAQTATLAGQAPIPAASEWEAKLIFGPPFSPPVWPKSVVTATPANTVEATSTVASPDPRNQPTAPTLSAVEIARLLARGDWPVRDGRCRLGPSSLRARRGFRRGASGGEVGGDFRFRLSGRLPSARFARGSGYGRALVSSCPRPRRDRGRQSTEKARSKGREKLTRRA